MGIFHAPETEFGLDRHSIGEIRIDSNPQFIIKLPPTSPAPLLFGVIFPFPIRQKEVIIKAEGLDSEEQKRNNSFPHEEQLTYVEERE
jgi:hypothetical protein